MPVFRVRFADDRPDALVEGDDAGVEVSGAVVVYRTVTVIGRPRQVVAARYTARDGVVSVEPVSGSAAPAG